MLWAGLLVLIGGFILPDEGAAADPRARDALLSVCLSIAGLISLTAIAGLGVNRLNRIAARAARRPASRSFDLTLMGVSLFAAVTSLAHLQGWIPLPLAGVLAAPCLFLPMLTLFIHSHPAAAPEPVTLTLEEDCRVKEAALNSGVIREFFQRYPGARLYIYKRSTMHSAGGLFLHNRDRLPWPETTLLDVTLDCPFAAKMGVLAEGREIFRAYLARPLDRGFACFPLPHQHWDDWLAGLTQRDWMSYIDRLAGAEPTHPHLGDRPCQFVEKTLEYRRYALH
ncbi:MAG: hypothetical protein GC154_06155 [bacterium]|nr:hypothetical protein [bacterium]